MDNKEEKLTMRRFGAFFFSRMAVEKSLCSLGSLGGLFGFIFKKVFFFIIIFLGLIFC